MKYLLLIAVIAFQAQTLTDKRDNRQYTLVEVAGKKWIKENLKFQVTDSGAVSYVPKNYVEEYGSYNTSLSSQKICPNGYHIPTKSEWLQMINNLSGTSNERQGKVVAQSEFEKLALKLGGIGRSDTAYMTETMGFYWTSSDTLKTYYKDPDAGLQRHIIAIHLWRHNETDSFNIEPTYMLAQGRENTMAISCKCVAD